jgi:hypothetical protein
MCNPLRRLSPGTLISLLALFVALGGTSYAAVTISGKNVKNGSLSGADVKNSSLSGADVKNNSLSGADIQKIKSGDITNGTLLSKDFKTGQLPRGAQGPRGDSGPAGIGPAYSVFRNGDVGLGTMNTPATIATLSGLPAGAYVINAKTNVRVTSQVSWSVTCRLEASTDSDDTVGRVGSDPGAAALLPFATQVVHVFATNGGTVRLACFSGAASSETLKASGTKITAVRVSTLKNAPVTG